MGSEIKNIVLFGSGNGTNADNIIARCSASGTIEVKYIFCNKKQAGIYGVAEKHSIPVRYISQADLYETEGVLNLLKELNPDLIVLAGFLSLIPAPIVQHFHNRIINIHPALLPKYGGKGMYGIHVHEKVKDSGDNVTGITIHYVNEYYDKGDIILQARCPVSITDTVQDIAHNVRALEHACYPYVIFDLLGVE